MGTKGNETAQPWQVFPPIGNEFPEVDFSREEMAFVLSMGDHNVTARVLELPNLHNDTVKLVATYARLRTELVEQLPVQEMTGEREASAEIDADMALRLAPKMIAVNQLIDEIVKRAESDFQQASDVFKAVKSGCIKRFGAEFPPFELIVD